MLARHSIQCTVGSGRANARLIMSSWCLSNKSSSSGCKFRSNLLYCHVYLSLFSKSFCMLRNHLPDILLVVRDLLALIRNAFYAHTTKFFEI